MIDLATVKKMIYKQWDTEVAHKPVYCPPEAKFITGIPKNDSHLHYLETVAGLTLELSPNHKSIVGYDVIDEKKFAWFILRWQ